MKILNRGKLTWLVLDDGGLVCFDAYQATMYAPFAQFPDSLLHQMVGFVETSEPNEYSNWTDVLELAQACKAIGFGVGHDTIDRLLAQAL